MGEKKQQKLIKIQEKRKKMIDSAKMHGIASEYTIRCSEELDQLIFEYQWDLRNDKKQASKAKFSLKNLYIVLREKLVEAKYQAN